MTDKLQRLKEKLQKAYEDVDKIYEKSNNEMFKTSSLIGKIFAKREFSDAIEMINKMSCEEEISHLKGLTKCALKLIEIDTYSTLNEILDNENGVFKGSIDFGKYSMQIGLKLAYEKTIELIEELEKEYSNDGQN